MPLYEYECSACKHRFERIQKYSDKPTMKCERCGAQANRLLSSPAIQFKGTGWYVTDYGKGSASTEGKKASTSNGGDKTSSASESTPSTKETPKTSTEKPKS